MAHLGESVYHNHNLIKTIDGYQRPNHVHRNVPPPLNRQWERLQGSLILNMGNLSAFASITGGRKGIAISVESWPEVIVTQNLIQFAASWVACLCGIVRRLEEEPSKVRTLITWYIQPCQGHCTTVRPYDVRRTTGTTYDVRQYNMVTPAE